MNHVYSGPRAYPGQQPQKYLGLAPRTGSNLKGLICMPLKQEWFQDRGASTPPTSPLWPRWIRNRSCTNRYKHAHILKAMSFPRPGVSCAFIKYIQEYF